MRLLQSLMISAVLALCTLPAHAADLANSERLYVGKTNILCVQAPCPWRGIGRDESFASGPAGLIWSADTLPRLDASVEDTRRIKSAWSDGKCLAIDGALIASTLHVESIVGPCP